MAAMKRIIILIITIIHSQGFQFGTQATYRLVNHQIPTVALPEKLETLLGNVHGQILQDKVSANFPEVSKKTAIHHAEKPPAKFVHGDLVNEGGSSYVIDFESPSETRKEIGFIDSNGALVKHGYFTYKTPEGEEYRVDYIADNKGFRVHGNHIPEVTGHHKVL